MEKMKKNTDLLLIILSIIILIITVICLIIYKQSENKNKDKNNPEPVKVLSLDNITEDKVYEINCKYEDCTISNKQEIIYGNSYYNDDYILIDENNGISLYDYKENRLIESFQDIQTADFITEENSKGLILKNNEGKIGIYNYELGKMTTDYLYNDIKEVPVNTYGIIGYGYYELVLDNGLITQLDGKYGVINYKNNNTLIPFEYDDILCYESIDTTSSKEYPVTYCKAKINNKYDLYRYDNQNKKLEKLNFQVNDVKDIIDNDYLITYNNNNLEYMKISDNNVVASIKNINVSNRDLFGYKEEIDNVTHFIIEIKDSNNTGKCTKYYYNQDLNKTGVLESKECSF